MCVMHIAGMNNDLDLKQLRSARGWTQQQMADFFGVDKATIWRWENEGVPKRGPSRKAIEREIELSLQASADSEAA